MLPAGEDFPAPSGYYEATIGLSGTTLDSALNNIIRGHTVRSYAQLRQDLAVTDRDPTYPAPTSDPMAPTNVLLVYSEGWTGYSSSGVWDGGTTWNREHTWPDSRGVGQPDSGPDFSDMHHVRAADPSANSARGNKYFDLIGGTVAGHEHAPFSRSSTQAWEPPDNDKGWIARAIIYMATRYDGTEANTTDLVLVETPPTSTSGNPPEMGRKSTLLMWNRKFPPTEAERRRNQVIHEMYQFNRNPFIDHPEFADAIYEAPLGRETRLAWRYRHFSLAELGDDAVSGDQADPDGDGRPNLLEFATGNNPRRAESSDTREPLWAANHGDGLTLTYVRLRDRALSHLEYQLELSRDLQSWSAEGLPEQDVISFQEGAVALERVTIIFASGTDTPIFARLRISR